MSYFEKLHPWCITRPLPNVQHRIVARFRRRRDAEAHLQILNRLIPNVTHVIIFDPTPRQEENTESASVQPWDTPTQVNGHESIETNQELTPISPDTVRVMVDY